MSLRNRVRSLEQQLQELQQQICPHPAEHQQVTLFFIEEYRITCRACGAIIKTVQGQEAALYEQLRLLKEQINNLPEEEEIDDDET